MKTCLTLLLGIVFWGCTTSPGKSHNQEGDKTPPPPPLEAKDQIICDSLKTLAYDEIKKGNITIVFNDSIHDNAYYEQFASIIKNRLGFNYFRLYDVGGVETISHRRCVQPIMDSVIIARYGPNAKDSIIHSAYQITDSIYKLKPKRDVMRK
jgi:hypothetical protein